MTAITEPVFYGADETPGFENRLKSEIQASLGNKADFLLEYPVVYLHVWQGEEEKADGQWNVYIGESMNLIERTKQHYRDALTSGLWQNRMLQDRDEKGCMPVLYVFGHRHFNLSMTRDIENRLIDYCLANPRAKLRNGRGNPQRDYYGMEKTAGLFSGIWRRLRIQNPELFLPQSMITKSALYKASPNHRLTKEQEEAKEQIKDRVAEAVGKSRTGQLIFVEGEAGTGKTVLTSSTFYELLDSNIYGERRLTCHLLVNHEEQLNVYKNMAVQLGYGQKVVLNPTEFLNRYSTLDPATDRYLPFPQKADVVFVDEAHLLWTQPKQAYSRRYTGRQLDDIMERSRVTVILFDKSQILRKEQFDDLDFMSRKRALAQSQGPDPLNPDPNQVRNHYIRLTNQLRMQCAAETMVWIDGLTHGLTVGSLKLDAKNRDERGYEVRVFEDPARLHEAIREKAKKEESRLSRLTATYDWEYKENEWALEAQKYWRVEIGDWFLPWNGQHYWRDVRPGLSRREIRKRETLDWAEREDSLDEVGSIFTIQGFDLDYAGVILGPSVRYDPGSGRIWFEEEKRAWDKMKGYRTLSDGSRVNVTNTISQNELRVLLTRGTRGLYLYACDEELRAALRKAAGRSSR